MFGLLLRVKGGRVGHGPPCMEGGPRVRSLWRNRSVHSSPHGGRGQLVQRATWHLSGIRCRQPRPDNINTYPARRFSNPFSLPVVKLLACRETVAMDTLTPAQRELILTRVDFTCSEGEYGPKYNCAKTQQHPASLLGSSPLPGRHLLQWIHVPANDVSQQTPG